MNLSRQPVNLLDSLSRHNKTKKKKKPQETIKFYLVKYYSFVFEELSEKMKKIPYFYFNPS